MANQVLSSGNSGPDAPGDRVAFPSGEKQLANRLLEAMGDESQVGFARKAGVSGSTFRKYLEGAMPSADRLVAMADVAGVTVEWLAAGRGPKLRRDLVAALRAAEQGAPAGEAPAIDLALLRTAIQAVEEGLLDADVEMPPDKKAEVFVYAYELIGQMGATEQARALLARLVKLAR
jgi:transcriptional regulator with XRE-family HTH domain